jgi:F-type H+-transporting ATPase subunit gamma
MGQSQKAIKLRIKSVRNTRKITKAMELVAASKMRRAVASALRARPYAEIALESIKQALMQAPEGTRDRFLEADPNARKTLLVLMSSDRGLAGGLNVNMIRAAQAFVKERGKENVEIVAVGKRGADALERQGVKVIARFPSLTNNPTFQDLLPAARLALESFTKGEYKEVALGYTHFVSGITQKAKVTPLLPFKMEAGDTKEKAKEVTFEPSPKKVFESVLPALARTMLWQSLLESGASEHAARMIAMKNASDAAKDMLTDLTFTYNQARQASITQEIAEISSGKAALE